MEFLLRFKLVEGLQVVKSQYHSWVETNLVWIVSVSMYLYFTANLLED